ncbi:MAG: TauD/TfdA family dioxygenase [Proteobacteria bacterium]|nr:TauD/TfdA family dioxygenase [Pseudomonadota bacterium]
MQKSDQNTLKSALAAQSGKPADSDFDRPEPVDGPFNLSDSTAYKTWREEKLAGFPRHSRDLLVRINDFAAPTSGEIKNITDSCRRANMAIYEAGADDNAKEFDSDSIRAFAAHFGLSRLDKHLLSDDNGVTALRVADKGTRTAYIPYSSNRLGWHSDGYYNDASHLIRAVVLHCARPAASGGENAILDHEIAYIRLRDENPDFIAALMHPGCMTIPANLGEGNGAGGRIRPARTGPVFLVDRQTNALHMRFTARKRNIQWREDKTTRNAIDFLLSLLESDDGPVIRYRLCAGQGLISNNVLHNRTAFEDDPAAARLVYRARFLDRIKGTY